MSKLREMLNNPKLQELQQKYWVCKNGEIYECTLHNTFFDSNDEPCWSCYHIVHLTQGEGEVDEQVS